MLRQGHDHGRPGATDQPQPILTPLTEAGIFVILTIQAGGENMVREVLADVGGLKRSVGFRIPEGGLTCVVGIGDQLWSRLFDGPRPAGLHSLREVVGSRHKAIATRGDLLFHIRAHRFDLPNSRAPTRPNGMLNRMIWRWPSLCARS